MTIAGNRAGAAPAARLYPSTTVTCDGDLDLIAIERAINAEPTPLTVPEKIHAARLLDERGYDFATIGRLVASDPGTVSDWKSRGWPAPKPEAAPIDLGGRDHGSNGYCLGCRCRDCREPVIAAQRARRARRRAAAA
ncbi:hypothetical protein [Streptomyces katrae]|uniref:hypothetical protein n=1 Tax=Streptomyces katrae TaxID=68223 RepID=UPI0004C2842A|nr:hypothetical protein [Streptomyces katrae]